MRSVHLKNHVTEVLAYLEFVDPDSLNHLLDQLKLKPVPKEGFSHLDYDSPDSEEMQDRVTLCKTALKSVLEKCDEYLPALKRKLKALGRVQLVSQVLIIISGASLVTSANKLIPALTIITGALTLLGSILTLIVQYKSGIILNNTTTGIFSFYDQLVDSRLEAEQQSIELELALKAYDGKDPQRLINSITKVNEICLQVRKLLEKMAIIV